jgi:hypothetical protein
VDLPGFYGCGDGAGVCLSNVNRSGGGASMC